MLGRRFCGPRWTVLAIDPAINDDKSDIEKYRDALFDVEADHITILPGEKPSQFQIAPLTEAQKRLARNLEIDSAEWQDIVIRCGLLDIMDYPHSDEQGNPIATPRTDRKKRGNLGECLSDEWLEEIRFDGPVRMHLALMIWTISEARPLSSTPSDRLAGGSMSSEKES